MLDARVPERTGRTRNHDEHQEDRQALADARSAVRELRGTARRETWQARTERKRAEWAYRRRVRRAESELEQLHTPHRGALIRQPAEIALHESSVLITDGRLQLADMQVKFEHAKSTDVSYVHPLARSPGVAAAAG
ncbi:hypothetical protein ACFV8T_38330 [Streptomyces sp. NPDC059832]|uniref:hypothetical protein n=1 Tax=Streptomyces sp. NPDC059832 TaxID=3346966 RepID=UPI00366825CA